MHLNAYFSIIYNNSVLSGFEVPLSAQSTSLRESLGWSNQRGSKMSQSCYGHPRATSTCLCSQEISPPLLRSDVEQSVDTERAISTLHGRSVCFSSGEGKFPCKCGKYRLDRRRLCVWCVCGDQIPQLGVQSDTVVVELAYLWAAVQMECIFPVLVCAWEVGLVIQVRLSRPASACSFSTPSQGKSGAYSQAHLLPRASHGGSRRWSSRLDRQPP